MILLDTHVLLWLAEGSHRLGTRAVRAADRALGRDEVMVAAASFWEIAVLIERRRLTTDLAPPALRRAVLEQGIREVALTGPAALLAATLPRSQPDPLRRMIVATALSVGATLLSANDAILRWRGPLRTQDARR